MSDWLGIGTGIVLGLALLVFALVGMAGLDTRLASADHRLMAPTLQVKYRHCSPARDLNAHV